MIYRYISWRDFTSIGENACLCVVKNVVTCFEVCLTSVSSYFKTPKYNRLFTELLYFYHLTDYLALLKSWRSVFLFTGSKVAYTWCELHVFFYDLIQRWPTAGAYYLFDGCISPIFLKTNISASRNNDDFRFTFSETATDVTHKCVFTCKISATTRSYLLLPVMLASCISKEKISHFWRGLILVLSSTN